MSRPPVRRPIRSLTAAAAVTALAGAALLPSPLPASAHVRVVPDTTAPGSYALLTFRVPNEDPEATTTRVEVTLPVTDPFPSVSVQPLAGWDATVTEAQLPSPVTDDDGATLTRAPHTVTWTARQGQGIGVDQLQQFVISVGPLPGSGTVTIPATQTYSDGTVVAWDEPTPAGGTEPEHPAPVFAIGPVAGQPVTQTAAAAPDRTARRLGGAGLAVGVLGLAAGAAGLVAGRRRRLPR